jgi:hypothetical protein
MKKHSVWIALLIVCAGAAGIAKKGAAKAMEQQAQRLGSEFASAAFRDGLHLGRLAAERGESAHIAVSRWAKDSDRTLFASGYQLAYGESASRISKEQRDRAAAFRDGLFLGQLDSSRGDAPHVAVARWSNADHRDAFSKGYAEGFKVAVAARVEQAKTHLAQVIR